MATYKVGDEVEVSWNGKLRGYVGVGLTKVAKVDGNRVTVAKRGDVGKSTFDIDTGEDVTLGSKFQIRMVTPATATDAHPVNTRIKVTGVPHYSGTYVKLPNGRYKREGRTNRTVPVSAILGGTVTVLTAIKRLNNRETLSALKAGDRFTVKTGATTDGTYTVVKPGYRSESLAKRDDGLQQSHYALVSGDNFDQVTVLTGAATTTPLSNSEVYDTLKDGDRVQITVRPDDGYAKGGSGVYVCNTVKGNRTFTKEDTGVTYCAFDTVQWSHNGGLVKLPLLPPAKQLNNGKVLDTLKLGDRVEVVVLDSRGYSPLGVYKVTKKPRGDRFDMELVNEATGKTYDVVNITHWGSIGSLKVLPPVAPDPRRNEVVMTDLRPGDEITVTSEPDNGLHYNDGDYTVESPGKDGKYRNRKTGDTVKGQDLVTWHYKGGITITKRATATPVTFKVGDLITVYDNHGKRLRNDLVAKVDGKVTATQSGGSLPSNWKVEPAVTGSLDTKADKVIRVNRDWVINGTGRPFIVQIGDVEAQFDSVELSNAKPRTGVAATGRFANFVTSGPVKVGYTDSAAKPVAETTVRAGC